MSEDFLNMHQELQHERLHHLANPIEIGFWRSERLKYAAYGAIFGLLFPVIATLIQSIIDMGEITRDAMLAVQRTDPLLWIIDSAPFWLGLFASIAGGRQDNAKRVIRKLVAEMPETRTILDQEEAESGEAGSFALFLITCGGGLVVIVLLALIIWLQTLIHAS